MYGNSSESENDNENDVVVMKRGTLLEIGSLLKKSIAFNKLVIEGSATDATPEAIAACNKATEELDNEQDTWDETMDKCE